MRKILLALNCDLTGVITEVVINKISNYQIKIGTTFVELFDKANYEKAQIFFLQSVKLEDSLYDEQELLLPTRNDTFLLYFKGLLIGEQNLIIAESEEKDYLNLFGTLTSINNELNNVLRSLYKTTLDSQSSSLKSDKMLSDFSKLNNELIETQNILKVKNLELSKINDLKNKLVGVAAHDLRNPISLVYSYSQLLLEDYLDKENEEAQEFIGIINSTSKFMLSLVEDLLDLSYLESGEVILKLEVCDFKAIFCENINFASTLGAKKGIRIVSENPIASIYVNIDKNKIQQVINNFVSNAIKYSHPNSTIYISCYLKNDELIFCCRDEGFGISSNEFEIVFEPFKKAKSSQYIKEQSTGLGLAISKQIIKAHNGKIWLESQVDKGSTFYFSLPLHKE